MFRVRKTEVVTIYTHILEAYAELECVVGRETVSLSVGIIRVTARDGTVTAEAYALPVRKWVPLSPGAETSVLLALAAAGR